jgi:hypothetical protein
MQANLSLCLVLDSRMEAIATAAGDRNRASTSSARTAIDSMLLLKNQCGSRTSLPCVLADTDVSQSNA